MTLTYVGQGTDFIKQVVICTFLCEIPAPPQHELTQGQVEILRQAMTKVKDTVQRLTTDHRDLHSTVSKVGKAIDRNFVADFATTSREDVFSGAEKTHLLNQVICQHFYRQGMLDIADELASVSIFKTLFFSSKCTIYNYFILLFVLTGSRNQD